MNAERPQRGVRPIPPEILRQIFRDDWQLTMQPRPPIVPAWSLWLAAAIAAPFAAAFLSWAGQQ